MPIVGNGDIASVLVDRPDRLYFASGVSNSREMRESEYRREINLLKTQDQATHIVYFSSLAVFFSDTRYFRHKREMESLVRGFPNYTIVRLGNISFGSNPYTLINYLRAHPEAEVRDEYRYIVSQDELLYWVGLIPDWSCEMNVPGERLKVAEVKKRWT